MSSISNVSIVDEDNFDFATLKKKIIEEDRANQIFQSVYPTNPATNCLKKLCPHSIRVSNKTDELHILRIVFKKKEKEKDKPTYLEHDYELLPNQKCIISIQDAINFEKEMEDSPTSERMQKKGYLTWNHMKSILLGIYKIHSAEIIEPLEENTFLNIKPKAIQVSSSTQLCLKIENVFKNHLNAAYPIIWRANINDKDNIPIFKQLHSTIENRLKPLCEALWEAFSPEKAHLPLPNSLAIPHVHRAIYFGFDATVEGLPLNFQKNVRTWLKRMPTWEHEIWTSPECWSSAKGYENFQAWCRRYSIRICDLKTFLPSIPKNYSSFLFHMALSKKKWGPASDLLRAWLIFYKGGLYTDLDVKMLEDLGSLIAPYKLVLGIEPIECNWIGNAIMAAAPSHPGIQYYLDQIEQKLEWENLLAISIFEKICRKQLQTLLTTGPYQLSTSLGNYWAGLQSFPKNFLYDPSHPLHRSIILPPSYLYPHKAYKTLGMESITAHTLAHTWCK